MAIELNNRISVTPYGKRGKYFAKVDGITVGKDSDHPFGRVYYSPKTALAAAERELQARDFGIPPTADTQTPDAQGSVR